MEMLCGRLPRVSIEEAYLFNHGLSHLLHTHPVHSLWQEVVAVEPSGMDDVDPSLSGELGQTGGGVGTAADPCAGELTDCGSSCCLEHLQFPLHLLHLIHDQVLPNTVPEEICSCNV